MITVLAIVVWLVLLTGFLLFFAGASDIDRYPETPTDPALDPMNERIATPADFKEVTG